eukprot:4630235-Pyramimonas_sp.AAC.1
MTMRGQSVLITGAASGIGRETALALAKLGAGITVVDFDAKLGLETVALINKSGGHAQFAQCDVTNSSQLTAHPTFNSGLQTRHIPLSEFVRHI